MQHWKEESKKKHNFSACLEELFMGVYKMSYNNDDFLAHLCILHGGLICIAFCPSVRLSVCHTFKNSYLHSQKIPCQQKVIVLLLWQVGLIPNVKLHFLSQWLTLRFFYNPHITHFHIWIYFLCSLFAVWVLGIFRMVTIYSSPKKGTSLVLMSCYYI